jgi:hypothetical protein
MMKKLPRWFKIFLVIDLTLVAVTLFVIGYLIIENKVLEFSTISASNSSLPMQILAKFIPSRWLKGNDNPVTNEKSPLILEDQFSDIALFPFMFKDAVLSSSSLIEFGEPSWKFYGIDFTKKKQKIVIKIEPPDEQVNSGKPIVIAIFPANTCEFGEKKACIYAYKPSEQGNIIFLSIHSGVGSEAQQFRHAIEGTGINKAKFNLQTVKENLGALNGAKVTISQGDIVVRDLKLVATGRIPPRNLARYYAAPYYRALYLASDDNPVLINFTHPNQPQLVFETCGWKMRGEPWADGVTPTTASVYIGVIQK